MKAIALFLALTLAGCTSDIPRPIRESPAENIAVTQALKDPQQHRAAAVRWGGAIASIENRRDETWLEIVERPLHAAGPPRVTGKSAGRFRARGRGVLDA